MTARKRLLVAASVLALISLSWMAWSRTRPTEITLMGIVDADEVVVTPPVQARLDSLWVEEGAEVKAGQPIATLDRGELAAQAASAGAATANVRAQLSEASLAARQTEGEVAGALAAAKARLASARADVSRQEVDVDRLRNDASRASALAKTGGMSPADVERATAALRVQDQMVTAAREALKAAEADVRRAESSALAAPAARGNVVAAQARLRGAQADSAYAGARLAYTELRAPVNGIVQVLVARRGELVGPGKAVAIIVQPDHEWVRVSAPESDAAAVAVGDSLDVVFPSGDRIRGRVISKSAEGEFATQRDVSASKRDIRAVAFRVAIPNPKHTIVAGMSASVVLPTRRQ
ncbi:MAG: efflux RND transporter periplasmic adaptor subunit [Gemmatimonadota bacterium]